MTLYGHYIKYGPKCSDHIRSTILLLVYFPPPASPESWCPHVQTARPSEHSFSREYFLRESRGPRIYVFHTPRPSHTRADLLAVSKHRFRLRPAARAKRNRPPW